MSRPCENCGNESPARIQYSFIGRKLFKCCDRCGASNTTVPDVYFKGSYVDEHLASEEFPGPKRISSRSEKKMWLDKCNLRESGDRVHGATSFDPISHRHAEESLRRKS